MAAKKTIDPLFAAYTRTAPRLDLEFLVSHTRIVPMPLALLQACTAAHAAMVKDEATGRNHSKHMATVKALGQQYRDYRRVKVGNRAYFAPLFTAEEAACMAYEADAIEAAAAYAAMVADATAAYAAESEQVAA